MENRRSLIPTCINPSLELTPRFILLASPVMSRLTSSFTCQLVSVIITTLIIHHSFTPDSEPTFTTNPFHLKLILPWTAFTIMGPDRTYHASRFIFSSFFSLIFLLVPCGGLSWLHVRFLLHVKYTVYCSIIL